MPYLTRRSYERDRPVLYNNENTNNLHGSYITPDLISVVGGKRRVIEGSWLSYGGRLLARGIVLTDYTAGNVRIKVNNPWPFLPGDEIYAIGDETIDPVTERDNVVNATTKIGTVASVDPGLSPQHTGIGFPGFAIDDVITVKLEEVEVTYKVTSTLAADLFAGLIDAFQVQRQNSHFTILDYVNIDASATNFRILAKDPGTLFMVTASIVGAGTANVTSLNGVGDLVLTPDPGANLNIGAKVGTINQSPAGIIASSLVITAEDRSERVGDYAAYDSANVNRKALTYLDGDLVASIPTLKYMPAYV